MQEAPHPGVQIHGDLIRRCVHVVQYHVFGGPQVEIGEKAVAVMAAKEAEYGRSRAVEERELALQKAVVAQEKMEVGCGVGAW